MSGLAQPQDLLLHLGETFEADLHGKVTRSQHHRHRWPTQGVEQQLGERPERRGVLDLEHDGRVVVAQSIEFLAEDAMSSIAPT